MRLKVAILAGDGIGPEVTHEATNILRSVAELGAVGDNKLRTTLLQITGWHRMRHAERVQETSFSCRLILPCVRWYLKFNSAMSPPGDDAGARPRSPSHDYLS